MWDNSLRGCKIDILNGRVMKTWILVPCGGDGNLQVKVYL
jgi:hypothetical protein